MKEFAKKFKSIFKRRCKPMLGTFVTVGVDESTVEAVRTSTEQFLQSTNYAFAEGLRLEQQFSKFVETSTLTRVNQSATGTTQVVESEFFELMQKSLSLWQMSQGAFNPFASQIVPVGLEPFTLNEKTLTVTKNLAVQLDLNGIAKGFIVDRMVETIESNYQGQNVSAFVNAGGDVRYLNSQDSSVHLRSGDLDEPQLTEVAMLHNSFATSSWSVAKHSEISSTQYSYDNHQSGWSSEQTVGVNADGCWLADAMTKVAMYATPEVAQTCANAYDAKIFVFDGHGQIIL